jgi:hypothetical protein
LAEICDGFLTKFVERTGIESLTLDGLRAADGSKFCSVLGIGLSAWLLGLARRISCALTVKSAAVYRVWKESPWPDMMSMVFRFSPYSSITSDPTRLATVQYVAPGECEQALRVVQSMSRVDDVDERLRSNESLLEDMVEATMGLLRQARYDVSDYRMWCESEA